MNLKKEKVIYFDKEYTMYKSNQGITNSIFWYEKGAIVIEKTEGDISEEEYNKFIRLFEKVAGKKPISI